MTEAHFCPLHVLSAHVSIMHTLDNGEHHETLRRMYREGDQM